MHVCRLITIPHLVITPLPMMNHKSQAFRVDFVARRSFNDWHRVVCYVNRAPLMLELIKGTYLAALKIQYRNPTSPIIAQKILIHINEKAVSTGFTQKYMVIIKGMMRATNTTPM